MSRRVYLVTEDSQDYDCTRCPMSTGYDPFGISLMGCSQPCDENTMSWPPCPKEALYEAQEDDIVCSHGGVFVSNGEGRVVRAKRDT